MCAPTSDPVRCGSPEFMFRGEHAGEQTTHMCLCTASLRPLLKAFWTDLGDIVKQMINLYPCQVRLCVCTICSRNHVGMPYIPTDCYSPLADGKIHYIIKGIGGNNLGFVPAIVLTSNNPFDVIKIYAERQTLNMCLSAKNKYIFILSLLHSVFFLSLNILQMFSGKCRYNICHCASACYCI